MHSHLSVDYETQDQIINITSWLDDSTNNSVCNFIHGGVTASTNPTPVVTISATQVNGRLVFTLGLLYTGQCRLEHCLSLCWSSLYCTTVLTSIQPDNIRITRWNFQEFRPYFQCVHTVTKVNKWISNWRVTASLAAYLIHSTWWLKALRCSAFKLYTCSY